MQSYIIVSNPILRRLMEAIFMQIVEIKESLSRGYQ